MSAEAILEAGGLVEAEAKIEGGNTDVVAARQYAHTALGERVVVRLSPSALASGDDLEMEVLGFEAGTDLGVIGQQKRRALGFPGWALVNDPEHARFALQVVKRFKKHARRAKSKPGFAKEGFDELAEELGRSVPHFLPSFFEEAGRTFIEQGNLSYAAQMFEKGRAAERVHALKVDEELRSQTFLEFALAGAVAIKSLGNYSKDLAKAEDSASAHQHFRTLCVGRTLGGMPPWAGMPKELRKLAKLAKLKPADEDRGMLEEILEAPSLKKAAPGFWKAYDKALSAYCAAEPKARGLTLNLFPEPSSYDNTFDFEWLEMLERWGCYAALEGEVPEAARAEGGAAAWFGKLLPHVHRGYRSEGQPARIFDLLRRGAAQLKAEGKPLAVQGRYHRVDLDFADLALELGLELDLSEHINLELKTWAQRAGDEERGRDPVHAIAHERMAEAIRASIGEVMGEGTFDVASTGMAGFLEAKRRWLDAQLTRAGEGGIPAFRQAQELLAEKASARVFADCRAERHATMLALDPVPNLARSLRGGIPDELGWPALEEAVGKLSPGKEGVKIFVAFPSVVVCDGVKAVAVDRDAIALEHDLILQKAHTLKAVRYVGGQMLVSYRDRSSYDDFGYWSGSPNEPFEIPDGYYLDNQHTTGFVMEDGAAMVGMGAVSVGDRRWPREAQVMSDGTTCWVYTWADGSGGWKLRELDPRTGKTGRESMPKWLEDFLQEGSYVDTDECALLPFEGDSPLGSKDGFVGWRVRRRAKDHPLAASRPKRALESIDGRRWEGALGESDRALALLQLPGDSKPRPISYESGWRSTAASIWEPEGRYVSARWSDGARGECAGSAAILPAHFWHLYQARDEAGSKALRSVDEAAARRIFEAALAEHPKADNAYPKTLAVVKEVLPEVTHAHLQVGVVFLGVTAAEQAKALAEHGAATDPSKATARMDVGRFDDESVAGALTHLMGRTYTYNSDNVGQEMASVMAFFGREARAEGGQDLDGSRVDWPALLGNLRSVALKAVLGASPEHQDLLLAWLDFWAQTPFVGDLSRFRVFTYEGEDDAPERKSLFSEGGNDYLVRYSGNSGVLEYAPEGQFKTPSHWKIEEERRPSDGWGTAEDVAALRAALGEKGAIEFPDAEGFAAATGLGRAEAALVLSGMPNVDAWEDNFLPKPVREALGLKVKEAKTARDGVRGTLDSETRPAFYAQAFEELSELWSGAWVERLVSAWSERFGRRVAVDEATVAAADKVMKDAIRGGTKDALALFAEPEAAKALQTDGTTVLHEEGTRFASEAEHGAFTESTLDLLVHLIPWLSTATPAGDPLRAKVPEVLELLRARLANPTLIFSLGSEYIYGEGEKKDARFAAYAGEAMHKDRWRDAGLVLAHVDRWGIDTYFRPARITGPADIQRLVELSGGEEGNSEALDHTLLAMSEGFAAHAARVSDSPVAEGHYEADPRQSCPELVASVGAALDVSENAATLYLQTLALLDCTKKAVQTWNGWTAGVYKKACAELLARNDLVLEAKRARAGRALFLPGGWEALKSPHFPMESWKMPLYELQRREGTTQLEGPLDAFLPLAPLHTLFERAWARVQGGDAPRYEEVK